MRPHSLQPCSPRPPPGQSFPFQLNSSISEWYYRRFSDNTAQVELKREGVARQGRRMRRLCTGTLVHREQTLRGRVDRPGRRMRRVCTGTQAHCEQTLRGRVDRPGRRMRRVCTGTPAHCAQTVTVRGRLGRPHRAGPLLSKRFWWVWWLRRTNTECTSPTRAKMSPPSQGPA